MTRRFVGYWSKEQGKFVEELPPVEKKFGQAPMFSMGTIRPERHAGTGQVIDSVRAWDEADRITGCITTGTKPPPARKPAEMEAKRSADINQAMNRAINDLDWGAAPLSESTKKAAAAEKEKQFIKDTVGVDVKDLVQ